MIVTWTFSEIYFVVVFKRQDGFEEECNQINQELNNRVEKEIQILAEEIVFHKRNFHKKNEDVIVHDTEMLMDFSKMAKIDSSPSVPITGTTEDHVTDDDFEQFIVSVSMLEEKSLKCRTDEHSEKEESSSDESEGERKLQSLTRIGNKCLHQSP